jgi:hypothetical protein
MELFSHSPQDADKERLERLAEVALAFGGTLELGSNSSLHIYRALDSERIVDQATRQRLIPEIRKILQWHNRPPAEREDIIVEAPVTEAA